MKTVISNTKARLIRLIHIAKSQLGMDDKEYRTLLANVSRGKTSSKDLSVCHLERVLQHMKANGFEVAVSVAGRTEVIADLGEQMKKIRALWLHLHALGEVRSPAESSLHRFCVRQSGENWQESGESMSHIIEHLKQWVNRVERGKQDG